MKLLSTLTQIAIVLLLPLAAPAERLLVDMDLIWKPTHDLSEINLTDLNKMSALSLEIHDVRKITPATRIGMNLEEEKSFLPVETENNIADYVKNNLALLFKKMQLNVVEVKPEFILSGDLKDFYVKETDAYRGLVTINYKLKKSGKVIWQKEISGSSNQSGRSYKFDNYMEALSNSLTDSVQKLLLDTDFKKAFQTRTGKN